MTVSYKEWLEIHTYVGNGVAEGTMKDAMLHFFYYGVSPWIQQFGYKWTQSDDSIARKFVRLCYDITTTSAMDTHFRLEAPEPRHRDYPEDRETFDFLVDTWSFVELLSEWECCSPPVGTRLEYLLREFCYVWIDVESGPPGTRTRKILEAESDNLSDEERNGTTGLPDGNWSRRKYDLY